MLSQDQEILRQREAKSDQEVQAHLEIMEKAAEERKEILNRAQNLRQEIQKYSPNKVQSELMTIPRQTTRSLSCGAEREALERCLQEKKDTVACRDALRVFRECAKAAGQTVK